MDEEKNLQKQQHKQQQQQSQNDAAAIVSLFLSSPDLPAVPVLVPHPPELLLRVLRLPPQPRVLLPHHPKVGGEVVPHFGGEGEAAVRAPQHPAEAAGVVGLAEPGEMCTAFNFPQILTRG